MPITVRGSDGRILVGDGLDESQLEAMASHSPDPNFILEEMDNLNSEIEESNQKWGENKVFQPIARPTPKPAKAAPVARPSPRELRKQAEELKEESRPKSRVARKEQEVAKNMGSLEDDLGAISKKLDEAKAKEPKPAAQAPEPQQPEPIDMRGEILKLLANTPGAPTLEQIERMKQQLGQNSVYVIALGEGDVYIFTHLKRAQWRAIQDTLAKLAESSLGASKNIEEELKEKVCQNCVLWPKLTTEFWYNSRAGVLDRIYEAIMLNSYFLNTQQTMFLTTQL